MIFSRKDLTMPLPPPHSETPAMVVCGEHARASRMSLQQLAVHAPTAVDCWTVDLTNEVRVFTPSGEHAVRKFALLTTRNDVPSAGHTPDWETSHSVWLCDPSGHLHPGTPTGSLLRIGFPAPDRQTARAVTRVVAAAVAHGMLPLSGRLVTSAWKHSVQVAALALNTSNAVVNPTASTR